MQFLTQYLKQYGGFTFDEKAFCEFDALVFSQLAYIDFDGVVENGEITIESASSNYYLLHSQQEIDSLIGISEKEVRLLSLCAKTLRFGNVKICNYVNNINDRIDKQFSGVEFLFGDDVVVAFRGTDITVTGVKESAMLSYMFPVPAQIEALHYFQESAMTCNGRVYACGHSKGGFIAQYAALYCSKEVRDRIECVYNNDGPGFWDYSYLESEVYTEMLPNYRHFVPQSSFIGMMLSHDNDYEVIKSDRILGPLQHDLISWQFDGRKLKRVDDLTGLGKLNDAVLHDLVSSLNEEEQETLNTVLEKLLVETKQEGLLDFKNNTIPALKGGAEAWRSLDRETQKGFLKIFAGAPEILIKNTDKVRREERKKQREKLVDTLKYLNVLF